MAVLAAIGHALSIAAAMTWEILWALILGFAAVRRGPGAGPAGKRSPVCSAIIAPRRLARAAGLGAASSSCSYAAVALARSLFRKGANFTAAMAFEITSTNLVIELGIILALILGWQFTAAEFVGGPVMIVVMALLFRSLFVRYPSGKPPEQADRGWPGSMEGHAAMDMSIQTSGRSGPGCGPRADTPRSATSSSWSGPRLSATSRSAC